MKKIYLLLVVAIMTISVSYSQLLTWSGDFPTENDNISITMDAVKGNQGLQNYNPVTDVYVHTGVITNLSTTPTSWRYVKFNQNFNQPNAQLQATSLGNNKWKFDISSIRNYYGVPANETILMIAILFRNGNGSLVQRNADATDMYIPVYDNNLAIRFSVPPFQPTFIRIPEPITKQVGDNIALTAIANKNSAMKLYLNGTEIQTAGNVTTLSANPTLTTPGNQVIVAEANDGSVTKRDTFQFFIPITPPVLPLPAGVRDGINYEPGNTSVVLVLYAPGKNRVSVIGEFSGSNWMEQTNYVMNKTPDGNYWWLQIPGLTPGTEYAFQYLVDGNLKVGDPYCEKILDPANDGFISATTYPNLKPYPTGKTTGIVSILQTASPAYNWSVPSFARPDKRNIVVYELLLRDFLASHDWKTLTDTLSYLKTMGVNAVEIMPFNEFEGNESWGYNPDFYFAPDKYYGPKNSLKEFVDSCHRRGIAVIMDIALNHTTGLNPLAALYWNSTTNQPAANNPWLNVSATHPYNVFNDFNHESLATRYFSSRVMEHWLQEYKLDGFRFDLSKGFTQNTQCGASTNNEACFAQYHADRVAIWKRYYDTCQVKSSGSYVILEHFAENSEEIELSNYGMLLWGNMNYNFSEAAMGWVNTSNFEGYLHTTRGWNNPHLISYMESHDEERLMYKNLQFGNNTNTSYNIRNLNVALKRIELCTGFFMCAPGPKMIWEFGELGYDQSINRCVDGSVNPNCRLDNKPILWNYQQVVQRKRLYDIFTSLNKLRFHSWYKDVFIANNITISKNLAGAFKSLIIRSATDSSDLCVIGNFDVNQQSGTINFPIAGTWYDYLNGGTFTATGGAQNITLQPGEYHIFLNRNLTNAVVTPVTNLPGSGDQLKATLLPNPVQGTISTLEIYVPQTGRVAAELFNNMGQQIGMAYEGTLSKGNHQVQLNSKINNLPAGTYLLRVQSLQNEITVKFIRQ